jgi:hypothetical protein
MTGTMIGLSILIPIASGLISIGIRNQKIRAGLVILTALILIVNTIVFITRSSFPLQFTPIHYSYWEIAIQSTIYYPLF